MRNIPKPGELVRFEGPHACDWVETTIESVEPTEGNDYLVGWTRPDGVTMRVLASGLRAIVLWGRWIGPVTPNCIVGRICA